MYYHGGDRVQMVRLIKIATKFTPNQDSQTRGNYESEDENSLSNERLRPKIRMRLRLNLRKNSGNERSSSDQSHAESEERNKIDELKDIFKEKERHPSNLREYETSY